MPLPERAAFLSISFSLPRKPTKWKKNRPGSLKIPALDIPKYFQKYSKPVYENFKNPKYHFGYPHIPAKYQ